MGALEFGEHHQRLRAYEKKRDGGVAALYRSICGIDGVLLRPDGSCGICGRRFDPPPMDLSAMSPQERAEGIKNGIIPGNAEGLTDTERLASQFWARHRARHPEKYAQPAKPTETLAEKAKKFLRTEYSVGPDGQRIKTVRVVEMG